MPRSGRGDASEGAGQHKPDLGLMVKNVPTWGSVLRIDRRLTFCPPPRGRDIMGVRAAVGVLPGECLLQHRWFLLQQ